MRGPLKCVELGLLGVEANPAGNTHSYEDAEGSIGSKNDEGSSSVHGVSGRGGQGRGNNNSPHSHIAL